MAANSWPAIPAFQSSLEFACNKNALRPLKTLAQAKVERASSTAIKTDAVMDLVSSPAAILDSNWKTVSVFAAISAIQAKFSLAL